MIFEYPILQTAVDVGAEECFQIGIDLLRACGIDVPARVTADLFPF